MTSVPWCFYEECNRSSHVISKSRGITSRKRSSLHSGSNSEIGTNTDSHQVKKQDLSILIEQYNISPIQDTHRPYFPIYYNDVYEVPLPPKHRFPMSKYRQVRERVQQSIQNSLSSSSSSSSTTKTSFSDERQENTIQTEFLISPLISKVDLETTHCTDYIQRYMIGDQTNDELRNVGFPWSLEGVNRSLSSTGGTVAAAISVCLAKREQLSILKEFNDNGQSSLDSKKEEELGSLFAAHVAGGTHHAFHDRGEGFSVFSDIAVAANVVLREFPDVVKRILIIDLDGTFFTLSNDFTFVLFHHG